MNNNQFRRLVLDANPKIDGQPSTSSPRPQATPALGSRMRSSIPMTPRPVAGSVSNDFARQLAERNAELNGRPLKKFKSSAAPKGTKLAAGYQDRTQTRSSAEDDDKTTRIKALEEMVKLGQMDATTFEALRKEITGGNIENTHLVKGLDYALLDRVRRGEDVYAKAEESKQKDEEQQVPPEQAEVDIDEELTRLEEQEVKPLVREEKTKSGEMAPPPPLAGKKRTRNDILKELRASRSSALPATNPAQAPPPPTQLGPGFTKVGTNKGGTRIEKDEKGREVLITVNADGNIKRKVRKTPSGATDSATGAGALLMPDKDAAPLGMEVPVSAAPAAPEKPGDEDIFDEVGKDYDPLADIQDDSASSLDSDEGEEQQDERTVQTKSRSQADDLDQREPKPDTAPTDSNPSIQPPPPLPSEPTTTKPRNYFASTSTPSEDLSNHPPTININNTGNPLQDPTILAALKKASTSTQDFDPDLTAAQARRRAAMLSTHDRDAEDMDLGFGNSRFGADAEDEDEDDGKVKLSTWGAEGNEVGEGEKRGGAKQRKRGGKKKKRKGDGENAGDVLRVLAGRK